MLRSKTQTTNRLATECLLYYNGCDDEVRNAMRVLVWSVLDRMVRVKCANLKPSNCLRAQTDTSSHQQILLFRGDRHAHE